MAVTSDGVSSLSRRERAAEGRAVIDSVTSPAEDQRRENGTARDDAVRLATLAAAAVATLLAAAWVREPSVSYLAGALVATAAAVGVAWRRRTARLWMLLFAIVAVVF